MENVEEALNLIRDVDSNLSRESIPTRVILLMGQTKAGKTTLLYYLLGKKLIWKKNELDVVELEPEADYLGAIVSGGYESTTVYPNIPPFEGNQQTMIIDMPGFDDSRPNYRLLNIYIFIETLKLIKQVHICSVISQESNDGKMLLNELSKLCHLFNKKLITSPNCLSFVLTKVEDQQIKQQFIDQINLFINDQQLKEIENFHEDLPNFLEKHIYLFYNKQPIVKEGLELKEEILKNCNYQVIQKQPNLLLNQQYCKRLVGENDLEQFHIYLKQIIDNTLTCLIPLIQFFTALIHYEYREIFAESIEMYQQKNKQELKDRLLICQQSLNLRGMNKMQLIVKDKITINSQKRNNLSKCFQQITLEEKEEFLGQSLHYFSKVVSITKQEDCHFSIEFMDNLQLIFKNISSLIFTIQQIRQPEIVQQMRKFTKDEYLGTAIVNYLSNWNKYSKNVLPNTTEDIFKYQELKEIEKIPCEPHEIQGQICIQKISIYSRIRKDKVLNAINKAQVKINKNKNSKQILSEPQKEYQLGTKKIEDLTNNSLTLKYLKDLLISQSSQKRQILDKISFIFYRLSFLEEAICFKMSIPDENAVDNLVKLGLQTEELSPQFILEIIIPYYCESNSTISNISMCYDYLISKQSNFEKIIELEESYLLKINNNFEFSDNCYLLNEKYKRFDFKYINVILDHFDFYLSQSEKRQALYEKSCIKQLIDMIK